MPCSRQQSTAASGVAKDDSATKAFGRRSSLGQKVPCQPKPETAAPSAPPPTLEKTARSHGYLDKIASQVLRKTLNLAPPADRNAIALNKVREKLAAEVQAQGAAVDMSDEQMRKVPVVNEDLAAKLARRRGWEAEEEARQLAAQAAAQLLENEKKELEKQQREEESAKEAGQQAEEQRALQHKRELQIRKEIESQMEKSLVRELGVAQSGDERRSGPAPDSDVKGDEMDQLIAARKAAEAAAQIASLERKEIECRISIREQEKSKLRQARKRLEDEVRKAASEAERSEQPLRKSTPAVLSVADERTSRKVVGRGNSSDTLVPRLKLSNLLPRRDEPAVNASKKPVLESFASMQAAASIATAAAAAAAAAHAEQPRSLTVDGKLSDMLSGIDKLLRGEKMEQEAEQVPTGIFFIIAATI